MASLRVLKAVGLYLAPNEFGAVPEGAMIEAENVVIRDKGVIESRRGFENKTYTHSGTAAALSNFGSTLLVNNGTNTYYDTGSAFTAFNIDTWTGTVAGYGIAPAPTVLPVRFQEAQRSVFMTTSTGVLSLDATSNYMHHAGIPRAAVPIADPGYTPNGLDTGTWFADTTQVAYQVIWCRRDQNNILHLGAPSGRLVMTNSSGVTKSTRLRIPIPLSISFTGGDFYRVYRSELSASATAPPSDEVYLVYESQPITAFPSGGYISLNDVASSTTFGQNIALYTNPSQGGVGQANEQPPMAQDIAYWGERMLYANTTSRQRRTIRLYGAPVDGDRVSIAGQMYTFETTAASATAWSWYADLSGLSPSQSIEKAAQALVYAINVRNANYAVSSNVLGNLRAWYVSSSKDAGGEILVESTVLGDSYWTVAASTPTYWDPTMDGLKAVAATGIVRVGATCTVTTSLAHGYVAGNSITVAGIDSSLSGATAGYYDANFPPGVKTVVSAPTATTLTYTETGAATTLAAGFAYSIHSNTNKSDNDRAPNRIYYSKPGIPGASPLLNYIEVGSANKHILRIMPLRDKLFVFKEDGVFMISGGAPFNIDPLDDTIILLSAPSLARVNNAIIGYSSKGFVSVTDAGVQLIGGPLRPITDWYAYQTTTFYSWVGVGYESDNTYWCRMNVGGTVETFVYNTMSGAWSTSDRDFTAANVLPTDDKMYICASAGVVAKERKSSTNNDYCDQDINVTVSAITISAGVATVTCNSTSGVAVGDMLWSSAEGLGGYVSAVVNGTTVSVVGYTFADAIPDMLAAIVFKKAISCTVEYVANTLGQPAEVKHFREMTLHLGRPALWSAFLTFVSEASATTYSQPTKTEVEAYHSTRRLLAPEASVVSSSLFMPANFRKTTPRIHQRSTFLRVGFRIRSACSMWSVGGYTLAYDGVSDRNSRGTS